MGQTVVKTWLKACLILCISIQPPSSSVQRFVLILIQIMTARDNHILTVEMERFHKIFEWGDGVNGADPLTIIYPITLSIFVPSYYNGSISWIVNKNFTSRKGFSTPFRLRLCSKGKKRKVALQHQYSAAVCLLFIHGINSFLLPVLPIVPAFRLTWDIVSNTVGKKPYLNKTTTSSSFIHILCCHCCTVLTHGWALPTASGATLSSEQGNFSLQHLHPGGELLDCGWCWTTTCGFWDVDAVSECYLKKKNTLWLWSANRHPQALKLQWATSVKNNFFS